MRVPPKTKMTHCKECKIFLDDSTKCIDKHSFNGYLSSCKACQNKKYRISKNMKDRFCGACKVLIPSY